MPRYSTRREFGPSIYSRPRPPLRPTYGRKSWLDVLRALRKRDVAKAAMERALRDSYRLGVGVVRVTPASFWRSPQ